jgi:hypothetical protein
VALRATFASAFDKLGTPAKVAVGILAVLAPPVALLAAGLYALAGGFRETLHVYDPARHASIDTGLTQADLTGLKPSGADGAVSPLAEGAKRQLALQVLRAAGAERDFRLLDSVSTSVITDAAAKLVGGQDKDPLKGLREAHAAAAGQVLDPESLRMLDQWERSPELRAKVGETAPPERSTPKGIERPEQSPQEKQIRDFLAEVISPSNPADAHKPQGQRLHDLFVKNPAVLLEIYRNPEALEKANLPPEAVRTISGLVRGLHDTVAPTMPLLTEGNVAAFLKAVPAGKFDELAAAIQSGFDDFSFRSIVDTKMLEGLAAGAGGNFGKFMAGVLGGYFDGQATVDKRAMIASFLREARAGDGNEMKLVGLLKGAGPYMQKLLQLFGDNAQGPLKAALGELKAGLSPIHPALKQAMFGEIIQQSGGKIEGITGIRSLGAASVGETVMAKVQVAGEAEPRDVVIKLLRPGIQQRAERERAFFEGVARDIPGMTGTFRGIAAQIDTEMDLSREADNVTRAAVYNGGDQHVRAMQLIDVVVPKPGYMLLERAPGGTVQRTLATIDELSANPTQSKAGFHPMDAGAKLAAGLQTMAQKWFTEAMFGTGFYHGDLHSGNMMFSTASTHGPQGLLTAIDMGNATVLSSEQRSAVFKMVLAAGVGAPEVFVRNFEKILSPDGQRLMAEGDNRRNFQAVARGILAGPTVGDARRAMDDMQVVAGKMTEEQRAAKVYDDEAGTAQLDPGQKIMLLLEAANLLGMEIPATVANFSRSQMMLQKAITDINGLNDRMWEAVAGDIEDAKMMLSVNGPLAAADLPAADRQRFEAALNADPPDYQVLRSIAEQQRPPEPEKAVQWNKIRDLAITAGTERPATISFSDIIMQAAKNHKTASLGLAMGDLTDIATSAFRNRGR